MTVATHSGPLFFLVAGSSGLRRTWHGNYAVMHFMYVGVTAHFVIHLVHALEVFPIPVTDVATFSSLVVDFSQEVPRRSDSCFLDELLLVLVTFELCLKFFLDRFDERFNLAYFVINVLVAVRPEEPYEPAAYRSDDTDDNTSKCGQRHQKT